MHTAIIAKRRGMVEWYALLLRGQMRRNSIWGVDGVVFRTAQRMSVAEDPETLTYTYVASLPAYFRMILLPPGWSNTPSQFRALVKTD